MQKSRLEQYGMMVAAGAGLAAAGNAIAAPMGTTGVSIDIPEVTGYLLDIDGDGTGDVGIYQAFGDTAFVYDFPTTTGVIASGYYTSNIAAGTLIDGGSAFEYAGVTPYGIYGTLLASTYAGYGSTEFDGGGIMGVTFDIGGSQHYGWVSFGAFTPNAADPTPLGTITGYGYNDVAGAGIEAGQVPEPGSLALLAMGAVGIMSRRSRKSA